MPSPSCEVRNELAFPSLPPTQLQQQQSQEQTKAPPKISQLSELDQQLSKLHNQRTVLNQTQPLYTDVVRQSPTTVQQVVVQTGGGQQVQAPSQIQQGGQNIQQGVQNIQPMGQQGQPGSQNIQQGQNIQTGVQQGQLGGQNIQQGQNNQSGGQNVQQGQNIQQGQNVQQGQQGGQNIQQSQHAPPTRKTSRFLISKVAEESKQTQATISTVNSPDIDHQLQIAPQQNPVQSQPQQNNQPGSTQPGQAQQFFNLHHHGGVVSLIACYSLAFSPPLFSVCSMFVVSNLCFHAAKDL